LDNHIGLRATTQVRLTSHLRLNSKGIICMDHLISTFYYYIQSETLTHIRHINISPFKCETLCMSDLVA